MFEIEKFLFYSQDCFNQIIKQTREPKKHIYIKRYVKTTPTHAPLTKQASASYSEPFDVLEAHNC